LLKIARGRLSGCRIDDEELLLTIIRRVDPRSLNSRNDCKLAPRPLFAAAAGQAIAELLQEDRDIKEIAQKLEQRVVLTSIIERERAANLQKTR
jgi:hypothetical protein